MTPGEPGPEPVTDSEPVTDPEPVPETARERARRRRRLAEVFGEVLPDQTRDDADEAPTRSDGAEEWLRRQVPPHHG